MKKIMIGVIVLMIGFLTASKVDAQAGVGININIGDQPRWRAPGYDYVEYYYLPDIDTYYYVPGRQFIYLSDGRWVFSPSLPYRYRNYDLYSGHKVVVNRLHAYNYYREDRARYYKKDNGNHNGWYKNKKQKHRRH